MTILSVCLLSLMTACTTHKNIAGESLGVTPGVASSTPSLKMDDYWVWGGGPVQDAEGTYHLFASRWPRKFPMHPGWVFHSEIVRAESDTLEGPYEFKEVVFERRDPSYFDARSTHNPTIHFHNGKYYLFYVGITYTEPVPTVENHPVHGDERYHKSWNTKRIGVAVADSPRGPWKRPDKPIMQPRPGKWDTTVVSNPAVAILEDGTTYLVYKSSNPKLPRQGPFFLGGAMALSPEGPFERVSDKPLFWWPEKEDKHVEDPYLWHDGEYFHIVMKDMTGKICGEKHSGVHASSKNFTDWKLEEGKVAYSRTLTFDNGETIKMGHLERPQAYIENGRPSHIFFATADGAGGFYKAKSTWNIPVKFELDQDQPID